MNRILMSLVVVVLGLLPVPAAESKKTAKEGLQQLHELIGSFKCTGNPLIGTREEKDKFWQEEITWQWQFKDKDVWLVGDVSKGKFYSKFVLRYLPDKSTFQLTATRDKQELVFDGKLADKTLTFERTDEKSKKGERIVFRLLHHNRHLVTLEDRPADTKTFTPQYRLGCTNKDIPFATVAKGPECIVSGGLGTMSVTHKGKTYYVCCSGCRDAFKEDPEKYIKEYEDAQKKK